MKRRILGLLAAVCAAGSAFGLDITVIPPTTSDSTLNDAIKGIIGEVTQQLNSSIKNIKDDPEKLIGAFANGSVYSSAAATPRGYMDFNLFSVTLGALGGAQVPGNPFKIVSDIKDIQDTLKRDGDVRLGAGIGLAAQVNLNTSKFLLEGLDLGIRGGFLPEIKVSDSGKVKYFSLGVVGNYRILKARSLAAGLILWRGLTAGTGFLFQRTTVNLKVGISNIEKSFSANNNSYKLYITDPSANLDMTVTTYTIPLEVNTAIRLFWFLNLGVGAGMDISFGSNSLSLDAGGTVSLSGLPANVSQLSPGSLSLSGGGSHGPAVFQPKLMTDLGFDLGPVVLDIPLTYYPVQNGLNAGVTLGVQF